MFSDDFSETPTRSGCEDASDVAVIDTHQRPHISPVERFSSDWDDETPTTPTIKAVR